MSNEIKPVCVIQGPVASRSGYGEHCKSIAEDMIKWDKFDVRIIPMRWGMCPNTTLDDETRPMVKEIKNRIITQSSVQPELFIQLAIPNEFRPIGKYNIGITAGIESTIPKPEWIEGMNRMNLNIVPSNFSRDVFTKAAYEKRHDNGTVEKIVLNKPIEVVFEGVDTNIYKKTNQPFLQMDAALDPIPETFCYLFVGHWLQGDLGADRKDVGMLIKIFSEVFKNKKNAPALILKTSGAAFSHMDKAEILRKIHEIRLHISGTMPNIYLIHGDVTPEELNRLYNHPKVKAHVSFSHGEGFCVLRDTQIITNSGIKNIQDITNKDLVITHTGKWKNVKQSLNRYYSGKMVGIKTFNTRDIIYFTPNHNIYTINNDNIFSWKRADELLPTDYLVYPVNKNNNLNSINISDHINDKNIFVINDRIDYIHSDKTGNGILNKINLTSDVGKLFGYFLAEGSLGPRNEIYFSFNKIEVDTHAAEVVRIFKSTFGIEYSSIAENDHGGIIVRMYSTIVNKLFENLFGRGASNKKIPSEFLSANEEFKSGLISGLFFGDGYITNSAVDISVVAENIIKNLRILLLEFGIISCWDCNGGKIRTSPSKIQHKHVVHRLRITQKDSLNKIHSIFSKFGYNSDRIAVKVTYPTKVKLKSFFKEINGINYYITKIKNLSSVDVEDTVYNLDVDGDESYLTENFVVHNCRPLLEATLSGKPVLASNWSGHLDFLPADLANLLPGTLGKIPPSACNDWLVKEASWFNVDYSFAARKMEDVYLNYINYIPNAEKLRQQNAEKFNLDAAGKALIEVLNKHLPVFEKKVAITLPRFKKIQPNV